MFALAASSIACLLAEFYRLCPMRAFTLFVFLPALAGLAALSLADLIWGDGRLWRGVTIGVASGLIAAGAYDIFRLPFVFAQPWGIDWIVPPLNLFKVFPAFGSLILGEPSPQRHYSLAAHLFGWAYHFSNGVGFGIMYVALIGIPQRRHWGWAVLFAMGLEAAMLLMPYPQLFSIRVTPAFVMITLMAHFIFGVVMGLLTKVLAARPQPDGH